MYVCEGRTDAVVSETLVIGQDLLSNSLGSVRSLGTVQVSFSNYIQRVLNGHIGVQHTPGHGCSNNFHFSHTYFELC